MKEEDKALDNLLEIRKYEAPSASLATRIIESADLQPEPSSFSLWQYIERFLSALVIPRPVYALAFTLVIGFIVGGNFMQIGSESLQSLDTFMYYEGDLG